MPFKVSDIASSGNESSLRELKKSKKNIASRSIFCGRMGNSKPSTPSPSKRLEMSPNKIVSLRKEFKFKGGSLNGSFQGADDSYISNPSIMENDQSNEKLTKKQMKNILPKAPDMKLSGFGNFHRNQLKVMKSNVKIEKRRESQSIYQEREKSMGKLRDVSDKKIPTVQRYYSPYQGPRKSTVINQQQGQQHPLVYKGFGRSTSIAQNCKKNAKKNTRISLFG